MSNDINKIKKLRQSTGAGFKDCSAALQEGNGYIEKARDHAQKAQNINPNHDAPLDLLNKITN